MNEYAKIWKAVNRKRQVFEARGQRAFKKALVDSVQPVIDSLKDYENIGDYGNRYEGLIKDNDVDEAYQRIWGLVAGTFAADNFKKLKSNSLKLTYKDFENDYFIATVSERAREIWLTRAKKVTETTKQNIGVIIQNAAKQGLSIDETEKLIKKVFEGRVSTNRARTIARTEIISASNYGSLEGARATGLDLVKIWISTAEDRTREAHETANGIEADLNGKFLVDGEELEYPGDPSGSAENIINCRCTEAFRAV